MSITLTESSIVAFTYPPHVVIRAVEHPIEIWTEAHGWIESALDTPLTLLNAADVFDRLLRHEMDLWGIYRHGHLCGCFVTQIERGSKGRALNVIALGGSHMTEWLDYVVDILAITGREHGCKFVVEMGRQGWTRVLERLGWRRGPATMLKVL